MGGPGKAHPFAFSDRLCRSRLYWIGTPCRRARTTEPLVWLMTKESSVRKERFPVPKDPVDCGSQVVSKVAGLAVVEAEPVAWKRKPLLLPLANCESTRLTLVLPNKARLVA